MKNKIKLISLFLILLLVLGLTGCGKKEKVPQVDSRKEFFKHSINILSIEQGNIEIVKQEDYKNTHLPGNVLASEIITVNEIENKIDKTNISIESLEPLKMSINKSYASTETGIENEELLSLIINNKSYFLNKSVLKNYFNYLSNNQKLSNYKENTDINEKNILNMTINLNNFNYDDLRNNNLETFEVIDNIVKEKYITINKDELKENKDISKDLLKGYTSKIPQETTFHKCTLLTKAIIFELFKQTEYSYPQTITNYDAANNYFFVKFDKVLLNDFTNKLKGIYDLNIDSIINYYCGIYDITLTESSRTKLKEQLSYSIHSIETTNFLNGLDDDDSFVIAIFPLQGAYKMVIEESYTTEHTITTTITLAPNQNIKIENPQNSLSIINLFKGIIESQKEEVKEEIKEETKKEYEFLDDIPTNSFAVPSSLLDTTPQSKEFQIGKTIYTWPIDINELRTIFEDVESPTDFASNALSPSSESNDLLGYENSFKEVKTKKEGIITVEELNSIKVAARFISNANSDINIILPQGIQVNKTKEDLTNAYGAPNKTDIVSDTQCTYTYEYKKANYRLQFVIYNNLIDEIIITNIK